MVPMDGILRCSRYAFGPNRLHYCGPNQSIEVRDHLNDETVDEGLKEILSKFETMYPYLRHIAHANRIADPLDERVVEAYWLGNELLERVDKREFHRHLAEGLGLKNRLGNKSFSIVEEKIGDGALPHHSFHVLDVWKRDAHGSRDFSLESIDECRIAWGEVIQVSGPFITVKTERIVLHGGKLTLGLPGERKLVRELESEYDIEQLKKGDIVSIHWGIVCETLTKKQAANLKKYTLRHLALANETF
jgi:hypothetical protein